MMRFNLLNIILLAALLLCLLIQLFYYWFYLYQPFRHQRAIKKGIRKTPSEQPPVSVIVYARNKAVHLETYLPSILEQSYPKFEVIVINENSTDDTELILNSLSLRYRNLYHTALPGASRNLSRKKLALTLGVKAAHHDVLLFIEADAHPLNNKWLESMARHFTSDKTVVLGGSFLEKYPSRYAVYDYFHEQLQMMAFAIRKKTFKGNGRNLAYRKDVFEEQKGFANYNFIDAGEDDLLVAAIATQDNVAVELSPETSTAVDMERAWMWKEYKLRRALSYPFYKSNVKFLDLLEQCSRLAFYALSATLSVLFFGNWILLGCVWAFFFIRFFIQIRILNRTAKILNQAQHSLQLIGFDLVQPFVNLYFYLKKQ